MRFKIGDWVVMDTLRAHHLIKKGQPDDILQPARVVSIREQEDKGLHDGCEVITVAYPGYLGDKLAFL